ncbi:MAG: hypothetical protein IPG01_08735 [Chitinophagaceae bacterium]|nr:hypothetical protein [Chitinophagaceae bacterium]
MKKTTSHIVIGVVSLLFILNNTVVGQELSNVRFKKFYPVSKSIKIDSFSLVPGSVSILDSRTDSVIAIDLYSIDAFSATLTWKSTTVPDSIEVTYKVMPFAFAQELSHKQFERYNKQDSLARQPIIYSLQELSKGNNLDLGTMNYNGSFSRGITFGNNQDLVVNSGFNLQLQGRIAGDVEVLAALSDNNIPIQPEGNSQQLQEFDKVFIQLKKNKSSLVVGDFELQKPEGYFMNYYKKLQGASFSTVYKGGPRLELKTQAGVALAKGKYAQNNFNGQEGNQGPYRLTGNNGETYIIILSGTERVFIDGKLLERGADHDYVIDYNSGELIFTTNRLITKDLRISVEFQYSAQAYLRSVFFAGQEFQQDRSTIRVNFYTEQDSKNQPVQQELSDSQKIILSEVGDSVQQAYYQSIDSVPYTADRILYRKVDTLGYVAYVYSTNPELARYALSFSFLGAGNGNYNISTNLANGRVYQWVAPVDGIPQGSYEPVVPLIAPQSTQLLTIGGDFEVTEKTVLSWEGALSNRDINTFSDIDNDDNGGVAAKLGWNQNVSLNNRKDKPTSLSINGQYEFASATFNPIERYRPVEFDRNWNLSGQTKAANENLAALSLNLQRLTEGNLQYVFSFYNRNGDYRGLNNALNGTYQYKGFRVGLLSSYLLSTTDSITTAFLRPALDVSQSFKFLMGAVLGVNVELENNRLTNIAADTLTSGSFNWQQGKVYFRSSDTATIRYNIDYGSRIDYSAADNRFVKTTIGNTLNAGVELLRNPNSILRTNVTYRTLSISDTLYTEQQPDESLLGRLGYDWQIKKGFIVSNTLYELGSVQEQKKEFAYTPVPDGTGVYTWNDYNGDNVQQINEFEIAVFQSDANYIKLLLPTNQYVKAYSTLFNESLSINPRNLWKSPQGIQEVITRFSGQATLQISKKTIGGDFGSRFNPFLLSVADSLLLSNSSLVSGFLYFNRSNPHYGIDFSYQNNRSKLLLTNGFESRDLRDYGIRWRWNITRKFSSIVKVNQNQKGYFAEYFPDNNYIIIGYFITPQLTYQPSGVFRATLSYSYGDSRNSISDGAGEEAVNNKVSLDVKYNVVAKSVINVTTTFASVQYTGTNNTPVQYTMLEGLQPGENYLLNISFDRKLSNFIEMSLSYEGRKTGDTPLVNTGRAQVRAIF